MLRRQRNRAQLTQLLKRRMQGDQVQARFQSKMVQTGRLGEQFQLDISAESRKQVVGLYSDGVRGRLFERNVLLQRFMERFDIPPFTVEVDDGVARERGLAAHQILDAGTPVFVGEDLLDQRQREIDAFQVDFPPDTRSPRGAPVPTLGCHPIRLLHAAVQRRGRA